MIRHVESGLEARRIYGIAQRNCLACYKQQHEDRQQTSSGKRRTHEGVPVVVNVLPIEQPASSIFVAEVVVRSCILTSHTIG